MSGVVGPRPVPSAQFRIPVLALQAPGAGGLVAVQFGEGPGQLVERAAQDPDVVGMLQIRSQGGLGRLVLQVAPQVGAAQAAAQALLGDGEGLLVIPSSE